MKLYDGLKNVGKALLPLFKKGIEGQNIDDQLIYKSLRQLLGSADGVVKPYIESIWVYSSVNTISQNISNVPLKIYKPSKDDKEEKEIVLEAPVIELFKNPNPYMTGKQLIESMLVYMGLRGEAFWILENRDNVTQLPTRIWSFDPARFTEVMDPSSGMLIGWKYTGKRVTFFGLHEVIQFKNFNPYNDIRGLAPLVAASEGINQDFFANKYNKQFFKEGASISGFIEVQDTLNDTQYNRVLRHFNEQYKGVDKAHKIGILEGGAKFSESKITQRDMEFIKGKKVTREEIFAAYKTNSVVLGIYEDVKSYEGIKTAHKTFWQEALIPKMKYIETMVNTRFLNLISTDKYFAEFDLTGVSALQEDFKEKVESAKVLSMMGYPINMINKRLTLGMDVVPWGNRWYYDQNLFQTEEFTVGPLSPKKGKVKELLTDIRKYEEEGLTFPKEFRAKLSTLQHIIDKDIEQLSVTDDKRENLESDSPVQKSFETLTNLVTSMKEEEVLPEIKKTAAEDEETWTIFLSQQRPVERKFLKAIRGYFFKQRKRVLQSLDEYFGIKTVENVKELYMGIIESPIKEKALINDIFDSPAEEAAMRNVLSPLYEIATAVGVAGGQTILGDATFIFDPLDPDFLGNMELRLQNVPPQTIGTVQNQLRVTLIEGISLGESVPLLAERVRDTYRLASSRALTIARTESASAINVGRYEYFKKKGITRHRWLTALDSKVRPTHTKLNGSIALLGDYFYYNDGSQSPLRYPNDMTAPPEEVINCRCLALPVIEKT